MVIPSVAPLPVLLDALGVGFEDPQCFLEKAFRLLGTDDFFTRIEFDDGAVDGGDSRWCLP